MTNSTQTRDGIGALFPGQGTQSVGMGADLFDRFPDRVAQADSVMGISMRRLCLEDPDGQLAHTQWAQPAIFLVSVLALEAYRQRADAKPITHAAGHSLGEYAALHAAGALDFDTALRVVRARGLAMAEAGPGAMAAVRGLDKAAIDRVIQAEGMAHQVVVANHNTPDQIVISGAQQAVPALIPVLEAAGARAVIPLKVLSAFHSPLMAEAARSFAATLRDVTITPPQFPVIANVTARPHGADPERIKRLLAAHFTAPVRWVETVRVLEAAHLSALEELGPGAQVLTKMVAAIRAAGPGPIPKQPVTRPVPKPPMGPLATSGSDPLGGGLGSAAFRAAHNCRLAYAAGSMYQGIASADLVRRMASNQLLAYLGSGGLGVDRLEPALADLSANLSADAPWGANLLPDPREAECAQLLERYGVRRIEASAYVRPSEELVAWRLRGLSQRADGQIEIGRLVSAKVSRTEVAERFLAPAPEDIVRDLVAAGRVTQEQANWSRHVPLCDDLTAEADSGGHTDGRNPYALLPVMTRLRDRLAPTVRVGAAGGIGTPDAVAAAFLLGADYVVTGSVNQCTVEAGTSDAVKDRLAVMGPEDTAYAPSGQYFESGARVQVLRKGTLFASRASTLHDIYRTHEAVEDLGSAIQARLEGWFGTSLDEVWRQCCAYWPPEEIERAEKASKHKLALVLRWYFGRATRLALQGEEAHAADFQIHTGPALGAFNEMVAGTDLEPWRARHADRIADLLMGQAAILFAERMKTMSACA